VGGVALSVPGVLKDYQKSRITVFVDPNVDPSGAGYNLSQVRIAIGSGGWTGTGLFNGPQTNGRFVPEQQTDFIYSVAGEELGFLGAGLIIVLLGLIVWRALRIAGRAPDAFGRLAAAGIATWIGFQAFENIGMSLGIMPMTGVPLPFVSYGGSSMFALAIAIGVLQQINLGAE
jgi:rod shape determining protein RodA